MPFDLGGFVRIVTRCADANVKIYDHDKLHMVLPGGSMAGPVVGLSWVTHITGWFVCHLRKTCPLPVSEV